MTRVNGYCARDPIKSGLSIELNSLKGTEAENQKMPTCLHCLRDIPNPRIQKGVIVQKFCNSLCRSAYHNRLRTKTSMDGFVTELQALLKKYGLNR